MAQRDAAEVLAEFGSAALQAVASQGADPRTGAIAAYVRNAVENAADDDEATDLLRKGFDAVLGRGEAKELGGSLPYPLSHVPVGDSTAQNGQDPTA